MVFNSSYYRILRKIMIILILQQLLTELGRQQFRVYSQSKGEVLGWQGGVVKLLEAAAAEI